MGIQLTEQAFWFFVCVAFLFGINIGSFLNVCIFRMPRDCVTVNYPRWSFCPRCRRSLTWYENQPLVGWLMLRGRCAGCSLPISLRYPSIELLVGLLFVGAAFRWLHGAQLNPAAFVGTAVFLSVLVVAAMIDTDLKIIPDRLDLPGMILAPIFCFFVPSVIPHPDLPLQAMSARRVVQGPLSWWDSSVLNTLVGRPLAWAAALEQSAYRASFEALLASILGLLLGVALLWGVSLLGRSLMGKEVMGFGDVKFLGMIGAFVGVEGVMVTLIGACFLGSIGGLFWKYRSGSSTWTDEHAGRLSTLSTMLIRPFVDSAKPPDGARSKLEFKGLGAVFARFISGQSVIPFGPYLAMSAAFYVLQPELSARVFLKWWPSLFAI